VSAYGLLVFSLVYALAVAAPGPGVAVVLARGISRGTSGAGAFLGGFLAGDLVWFTLAALGLAMLAHAAHALFMAIRYAGALYLLVLAWRLWRAPAAGLACTNGIATQHALHVFAGSLALTLGNPKTMVFFLAILPTVVDLAHLTAVGFCAVALVIGLILPCVLGAYLLFAARARVRLSRPATTRWLQRGTGVVMAGAAVAVATR
jgi:threonine/homoserine/homoserine lactone efflux protein